MKWRIFLPSLLILLGVWLWQESLLAGLRDRETALRRPMRIPPASVQAPAPYPVVQPVEAAPVKPPPPPDSTAIARSILTEYADLLSERSGFTKAGNELKKQLLEERLAAHSAEVLKEALRLLEEKTFPASKTGALAFAVVNILARSDPAAGVRYAAARTEREEYAEILPKWLNRWSARNPEAAQRWFNEMKEQDGFKKMSPRTAQLLRFQSNEEALAIQLLSGRMAADPAAFDFKTLETTDANSRFRFAADALRDLNTPEKREAFTKRVWTDVGDPKAAEKLLTLAASSWARRVPFSELKQLIDGLGDPATTLSAPQQEMLSRMRATAVQNAGGAPSDESYAWALEGATDPGLRGHVIGSLINGWSEVNIDSAGNFINAMPQGTDRDQAILTFTRALAAVDSEAQLTWAASISDPALRQKTVEKLRKEIEDDRRRFPKKPE
ncbi:MAG TPA: hypothetical protein VG796_28000 [Verrucomicrobiales bacterium]|jgi:hypothetical protein|nr:hypothetical protein [Verrucomicrobiales bacterium]